MLCPVLARLPFGVAILMPRAEPLSEAEADHLRATRGFPDWDYVPPDESEPFDYKASDWGRLPGRSACCVGLFGTGTRLMGGDARGQRWWSSRRVGGANTLRPKRTIAQNRERENGLGI